MARAQQPDTVRRIGALTNLSKDDPEGRTRDDAFVKRLRQLGWTEDRYGSKSAGLAAVQNSRTNMQPNWWRSPQTSS
jgi:hypothetical protein